MRTHIRHLLQLGLVATGLAALIAPATLPAQAGRQLYLITGIATNNSMNYGVASELLAIDERNAQAVHIADIAKGSSFITTDHERRIAVIGGYPFVIDMNQPRNIRTVPVAFGSGHFCSPSASIVKLCGIYHGVTADINTWKVQSLDLLARNPKVEIGLVNWIDFGKVRTEGFWAPVDYVEYLYLKYRNGKLTFLVRDDTDSGIPAPADFSKLSDRQAELIVLYVNTSEMTVLHEYTDPISVGETEVNDFHVYDKKSAKWQIIRLEASPSLRAFGPWIATARAIRKRSAGASSRSLDEPESPGTELRKTLILNPEDRQRDQANLNMLFEDSPYLFPGQLDLYNIRSGKKFTIRTGDGDSEVLLIEGNTIYYRVNFTIFKATIGASNIDNPIRITNDRSVQLAHWAFLGPMN